MITDRHFAGQSDFCIDRLFPAEGDDMARTVSPTT
jgi:hypothetical protein